MLLQRSASSYCHVLRHGKNLFEYHNGSEQHLMLIGCFVLMTCREADPRLADVFVKKGAFLKMYTDYIRDFESMVSLLDETRRRNPEFDKIVTDFEVLTELIVNFYFPVSYTHLTLPTNREV